MFELHLGDGLTVPSTAVSSPVIVLGNTGQGKTVFLMQLVLELVKNGQTGLLYDVYGDLAEDIKKMLKSEAVQSQVLFISQEDFIKINPKFDKFLIVTGKTITDGARYTRTQGEQVLKLAYQNLTAEQWLIIDQACDFAQPEIFSAYLSSTGPKTFLCSNSLTDLSAEEREQLFQTAKQLVIYKPRNIDGCMIEKYYQKPSAKEIAAVQQYHFYWLNNGQANYVRGVWPVQEI